MEEEANEGEEEGKEKEEGEAGTEVNKEAREGKMERGMGGKSAVEGRRSMGTSKKILHINFYSNFKKYFPSHQKARAKLSSFFCLFVVLVNEPFNKN